MEAETFRAITQLECPYAGAKHGGPMRSDASQLADLYENIDCSDVVRLANEIQCHAFCVAGRRTPPATPYRANPTHKIRRSDIGHYTFCKLRKLI